MLTKQIEKKISKGKRFLRTVVFLFGRLDGVKPSSVEIFVAGRFFWPFSKLGIILERKISNGEKS